MRPIVLLLIAAFAAALVIPAPARAQFVVKSGSYADGATMPHKLAYDQMGCGGMNLSPDLEWSGAPAGTKSFVLIMHDPDAPHPGGWWHWVAFNIPASLHRLDEGAGSGHVAPKGMVEGTTDFGSPGYGGPCPPPGAPHHYNLTLYAIDLPAVPNADTTTTGPDLVALIRHHVLAKAHLTGLYGR